MLPAALAFPDISAEVFTVDLGPIHFTLHWYALAYVLGIVLGWMLVSRALKARALWPNDTPVMRKEQLDDLVTWLILGVIIGGRLGYVLFYRPEHFIANPIEIPMVWRGGMAFHGGFLGVVIAAWIWAGKQSVSRLSLADTLALAAPIGLLLGRIANFVNAELWGRPSTLPWAVEFPGAAAQACATPTQACARHPSQLYEAGLEGLLLGLVIIVLVWRVKALKKPGLVAGVFFAGYGASRFFVEFFRQADAQFITPDNPMGNVALGMSMGQLLSVPMILVGLTLIVRAKRQ